MKDWNQAVDDYLTQYLLSNQTDEDFEKTKTKLLNLLSQQAEELRLPEREIKTIGHNVTGVIKDAIKAEGYSEAVSELNRKIDELH